MVSRGEHTFLQVSDKEDLSANKPTTPNWENMTSSIVQFLQKPSTENYRIANYIFASFIFGDNRCPQDENSSIIGAKMS